MNKKIVVGLSGGVDSAVSSYLIKEENKNYEVYAVFMQNWDDFIADNKIIKKKCTQTEDWEDALNVANHLSIPIKKINFVNEYWREVFVDFLNKLKSGVTPNPDILCNSVIKFSRFANYVRNDLKADYLATGHYARIIFDKDKNSYYLAKCKDENKDQTYFLCQIDFSILQYLIFPLSDLEKTDVRKIAESINLPNAKKKDSTGICFIGENNFVNFISSYLEEKEGSIVNIDSFKVIGKHKGVSFFTLGQRKGLDLGGEKLPSYVVGKNIEENIVYVASGYENKWLYSDNCLVENMNWLVNDWEIVDIPNRNITARFRHRQKEVSVKLGFFEEKKDSLKVVFSKPMKAITPGQYAVFYDGVICLGGGIIVSTDKVDSKCKPNLIKI